MKEISKIELRQVYEGRPLKEVLEHFELRHSQQLYRLLDRAGIPRKTPEESRIPIRLVE